MPNHATEDIMKEKNRFLKVFAVILSVLSFIGASAVISFAAGSEKNGTVVSQQNLEGNYGVIAPSDKGLKEVKTVFSMMPSMHPE